jgi:hypothetical protein
MRPGREADRAGVRGGERHRQTLHHVHQLFERDERRQSIRKLRQKGQRLALLDVVAEIALDLHPIGDVDRVANHVRRPVVLTRQDVPVHPHPRRPILGDDTHHPGVVTLLLNPAEVVVEQMPPVRREELPQVAADAVPGLIAEGVGRRGIDRQDRSGQIVRANQSEAALNQLPVPPLALAQRVGGLLPGGRYSFNRGRVTWSH